MSVKAKLIIDDLEVNVLQFRFSIKRGADEVGHPCERAIFRGIELLIESRSDLDLAEWSFAPDMAKQIELHIYPVNLDSRTRRLYFYDSHLIGWEHNFLSTGSQPLTEKLTITAAGIKDSTMEDEYSVYWRTTYPDKDVQSTVLEEDEEPKFIRYYITDLNDNEIEKYNTGDKIKVNIETKNSIGNTITISLENKTRDFKYKDTILKNDTLENHPINSDLEQIELEVIDQQN